MKMIDYTSLCKGKYINEVIAQKIICEIFTEEEVPIWIGDYEFRTYAKSRNSAMNHTLGAVFLLGCFR